MARTNKSNKPLKQRLAENIRKNGDCLEWCGGISRSGYGIMSIDNKSHGVHRVSYELNAGPIPSGLCVLHRCDNRKCINPSHLFLGTKGENNTDRKRNGRNGKRHGEKNPAAKLNRTKVDEIHKLISKGLSQREIAVQFNVCQQTISDIHRRRLWKDSSEKIATDV